MDNWILAISCVVLLVVCGFVSQRKSTPGLVKHAKLSSVMKQWFQGKDQVKYHDTEN